MVGELRCARIIAATMLPMIFVVTTLLMVTGCAAGEKVGAGISERPGDKIERAIGRGVAFLKTVQNADGSWGTGIVTNGFEVYAYVPGTHDALRVGTTALCVMAMRQAGEKESADRGVEYLIVQGKARRDSGDMLYNVWANTYALEAMAREMKTNSDPRLKEAVDWQVDRLLRYQTYMGGWNYYDFHAQTQAPSMGPTSFGTAAGLVSLHVAKEAGVKFPASLVMNGVKRLEEMKLPEGGFLYSADGKYRPRQGANRLRGGIGRVQACNYALLMWKSGLAKPASLEEGMEAFFREHIFIDMGRKRPVPHESWYQTAGYYYYFGHYYAAKLINAMGPEARKKYMPGLMETILPHQEEDGSWWDFPMWDYHKPYGTAFAVMTLLEMRAGLKD